MTETLYFLRGIFAALSEDSALWLTLMPMLIAVELPLYLLVMTGVFRWTAHQDVSGDQRQTTPGISVIITCYGEGDAIAITIDTLVEQLYGGEIEILPVIDGAVQNQHTYVAALAAKRKYAGVKNRPVRLVPKWQRGGRVSTLNAGLSEASHSIVINVDGDTSFDNDMVRTIVNMLQQPKYLACGGALRVRNWRQNLLTRMQALEYMLSMQMGKTGMATWGVLNNISGAFGAFHRDILERAGGWDTHTAEDLDLTMRLKQYKTRYPDKSLGFATHAIGHTDVPDTVKGLVIQRLRWDGDLLFLFLRKHRQGLTPKLLGWGNFLFVFVYGVLQNVLLPLLVLGFTVWLLVAYPPTVVIALMAALYLTYLGLLLLSFVVYIGFISERPRADLSMAVWLPLYPVYLFLMRMVTAFSMVNEVLRRSHEESSMAPWWVLKRGKRF